MLFKSRYSDLYSTGTLISSSLNGMETLTPDAVGHVIDLLNVKQSTALLVTNQDGICIYDGSGKNVGLPVEGEELKKSLSGNDYFHCSYSHGSTVSICAVSVMYYDNVTGCVLLSDVENEQSAMIQVLEKNLFLVSLILEVAVIFFALLFAFLFFRRTGKLLDSFHYVRNGDYSYRINLSGHDELSKLSEEFNKLTEKLEDSEELRRRFVSDASHELKTPLASIKLLGETILQNDLDTETQNEFVHDICSEADRLNRMSVNLLQLSKMDSKVDEDKEIVSLQNVMERVSRMLRPIAEERKIGLSMDFSDYSTVLATEDDIYQVFFNLIENGIKYNQDGGKLNVTSRLDEDDVIVSVRDTGVGIPEDAQQHIFERFYRVDKARSRAAGGSGLGLSIVHDIVVKNFG